MELSWIIVRVALVVFALWGGFKWFERKNLYYPVRAVGRTPDSLGFAYEEITLVTEDDQRICAWWLPNEKARMTVLVCHGNAGNMGNRVELVADLHRMGLQVMIFDYRGYGKSAGFPTERGLYRDARAAYEWVREAQYDNAERPSILVYGRSLGAAVALQLALERPVKGVMLECAFTSLRDMGRRLYPIPFLRLLMSQRYDNLSKIGKVAAPVLIASSNHDTLVPFSMGRRLYEAAPEPKQFVELAGSHGEAGWHETPGYWDVFKMFVARCGGDEA